MGRPEIRLEPGTVARMCSLQFPRWEPVANHNADLTLPMAAQRGDEQMQPSPARAMPARRSTHSQVGTASSTSTRPGTTSGRRFASFVSVIAT
jgi:hypothetical protein